MSKINDLLGKNPVAIVGMASVFADSKNTDEFWENIVREVDCIREVPDSRWSVDDYYDPNPMTPDKTYCKMGGFIPDIDFNPMEFGLPPNILEVTDASQLLALLVARDALIDSGYAPGSEKLTEALKERTGVVLGVGGGQKLITPLTSRLQYPIWEKALRSSGIAEEEITSIVEKMKSAYIPWNENSFPGMLGNVISGRVANRFDLGGINTVVDAACAASLSAIKMALGELIEGRCDMMLTGGVDTDNSPFMYMSFSKTPAFSRKGSIRPFDQDSDGMLIGEGVGMIVCKRLDDAIRDGDRIYATINGVGSSSDGRFKSVYAPRPQGQALAMQRAYDEAGYDASTVGLIEAHGTGTGAGDLSEGTSVKLVFGKNDPAINHIALGSVKSMVGHTKAAAGVAGMIKAALALHNKVLPATLNITRPNPNLNIDESPVYVNAEGRPWFRKSPEVPRRAGVSAFGFGGVNLHLTLEEVSAEQSEKYRTHNLNQIALIHGKDNAEIATQIKQLLLDLQGENAKYHLQKLGADSQSETIPAKNARLGFVAGNVSQAIEKLNLAKQLLQSKSSEKVWEHPLKGLWYRSSAMNTKGKVVALFAGQGSQYVNMGRELAMTYPTFREAFNNANSTFSKAGEKQLTDTVYPIPVFNDDDRTAQQQQLTRTQLAQPAIGAMSAGMFNLFKNAGFSADYFAGHSFGELTALWAAGVMDESTFHELAMARGAAMAAKPNGDAGSMLAVKSDLKTLKPLIRSYKNVQVANVNSGSQIILGGATPSLEKLAEKLTAEGLAVKMLPVAAAFHTPFVEHAHKPFAAQIKKAKFKSTTQKIYSNTTGKAYGGKVADLRSTFTGHMLSSVLFKDEIENIYKDGGRIFVEFGPKNILSNLVKEVLSDKKYTSIALNANPKKDSDLQLREAVAQLAVLGMEVQGFDPFRAQLREPAPKGNMNVSISGFNYVSEPTKKKHIAAMSVPPKVIAPTPIIEQPKAVPTPVNIENEMTQEDREKMDRLQLEMEAMKEQQTRMELMLSQMLANQQATASQQIAFQNPMMNQQVQMQQLAAQQMAAQQMAFQQMAASPMGFVPTMAPAPVVAQPMAPVAQPVAPVVHQPAPVQATVPPVVASKPKPSPKPAPVVQAVPKPAPKPAPVAPIASAPVAAAPNTGAPSSIDIEKTLMEVIAEKTGYPSEMLELTMDMEADLGIDSIKRVEIFGAMTDANPSVQGVDPQELAELRTLQQIVDYISEKAGVSASAPSTQNSNVATAAPVAAAPSAGAPSSLDIEKTLMEVIAEKTGYPSEMLELTMDMEADLGIDSIKRVEIFGAMTDANPSVQGVNPQELAELRTLQQIVDYISEKAGVSTSAPSTQNANVATAAPVAAAPSAGSTTSLDIEKTLMEVIAEKTGYPSEMLELTMDMEADLGIDSIKRVEIFGAMTDANPSVQGVNPQELAELRTLQQIVDYISEKAGVSPNSAALNNGPVTGSDQKKKPNPQAENQAKGSPLTSETAAASLVAVSDYPNVPRSGVVLKYIPEPDRLEVALVKGEVTLVTNDGTTATTELCTKLITNGHSVTVLSFPSSVIKQGKAKLPKGITEIKLKDTSDATIGAAVASVKGKVSQFVHMHPHLRFPLGKLAMQFEKEKELIRSTYLLAKHLKAPLNDLAEEHRTAFMVVTRMDGAIGMQNPGNVSIFGGGLFGLTKCLNLEWSKVFCRSTDIAPEMAASDVAKKIMAEMFDADQCLTDTCYDCSGKRYALLAKPMQPTKADQDRSTAITAKSVFLVTGGARGVTADCVKEMATAYKCSFLLIGRSELKTTEPEWAAGITDTTQLKRQAMEALKAAGEKPLPKTVQSMVGGVLAQREILENLKFIKEQGSKVEYVAADITDVKALKAAVKKGTAKLGKITGVVHGAGRLADKLIENKTEQDFNAVFDVKVQGLLAVAQSINIHDIKHIIMFSSVAGFYGNVGQTDYAIANEILNRMAHLFKKNHPDIHVVSINWGAWDSGMVSPELKKIFKKHNVSLVPTDEGPKAMVDQLTKVYSNQPQVILGGTLPALKASADGPLRTQVTHRRLLETANPFLKHHMIQGNAVLPIINASTWMAQSAADLYPGFFLTLAEDVKLFKGIVFDGNQKDDYFATIKEIEKSDDHIKLEVTISSDSGNRLPTNHYRSNITLRSTRSIAPTMPLPDINAFNPVAPDASIIYEDGTLFHGDDFRGVKQILELSEKGTLLLCEHEGVDPNRQGQFPVKELNVFLTDVMYQSLLIWIRRYHDCASLPLSTAMVEIYKVLPFARPFYVSLKVVSSDEFGMEADITAFDAETGQVYMKSHKACVTMSKELQWV